MSPFVVMGCPIRNRAWMVPAHVEAIQRQATADARLALFYVEGDSTDNTVEVLGEARDIWAGTHRPVEFIHFNTGFPGWRRSGEPRYSMNNHANLALAYNKVIDEALIEYPTMTHLWLVDSDVTPAPDALERLLAADKDVVAAIVLNSPGTYNFMLGMQGGEPWRAGSEMDHPPELFEATGVTACVLYRREVLAGHGIGALDRHDGFGMAAGLPRFAPHPRSHDFRMMAALRAAGITTWVEPRAKAAHYFHGPGEEPLIP